VQLKIAVAFSGRIFMVDNGNLQPWHWGYWRLKLIPAIISGIVSVFIPVAAAYQILIGVLLYLALYCITWRKADGSRVFPPYLW
jgi:hypothetical protein